MTMIWLNKHTRVRNNLSPYIDSRLKASDVTALEAHLASCEACRRELDELRATVSALQELPQQNTPRSFAVTPQMLERTPTPVGRLVPTLGLGMRLAGAGVALVLTVVLIGDLAVGGGGSGSPEAGSQPAQESRAFETLGASDSLKMQPGQSADSSSAQSNAGAQASCPAAMQAAVAATPQPAPSVSPNAQEGSLAACAGSPGGAVAPAAPQAPQSTASGQAENAADRASSAETNGGISAVRVAEIALAILLIAILAAIAIETALRRRWVA